MVPPQAEALMVVKMEVVHRVVLLAETFKAVKMPVAQRAVPQTVDSTVVKTVCRGCPVA